MGDRTMGGGRDTVGGGRDAATEPGAGADPESWRPMAFGRRPARTIRDPLMEPLWPGRRVLVHILAGQASDAPGGREAGPRSVRIRDEAGLELVGHPDLRAGLLQAVRARELVVDGYLLPLPSLGSALAAGPADPDVPGVGAATRHLFLGTRSRGGGRGDRAGTAPRPGGAGVDAQAGALSFVAVDLLALDGEPITGVPLQERQRLLDGVLAAGELVRISPHVRLPAANWHRQWRALGFREMAVKDANSRYHPGESSPDWSIAPIPTR